MSPACLTAMSSEDSKLHPQSVEPLDDPASSDAAAEVTTVAVAVNDQNESERFNLLQNVTWDDLVVSNGVLQSIRGSPIDHFK